MKPCPYASSGCNYPEGECLDLCTPVQMADDLLDVLVQRSTPEPKNWSPFMKVHSTPQGEIIYTQIGWKEIFKR